MCMDDVDAQSRCLEIEVFFSETDLGVEGKRRDKLGSCCMWCHASVNSVQCA